jgi:hypothetical protein
MGQMTEAERIRLSKAEHDTRIKTPHGIALVLTDVFVSGLITGVALCAAFIIGLEYLGVIR